MTLNLKPYPEYQASGVPWLGTIPAHWQQLPGRACFTKEKVPNTGMQETTVLSLSYGQIVVKPPEKLHGLVPASFETYQIIEPYDIVIRPIDLQNDWVSLRTGLARTRGIITSAYMRLQTKAPLLSEYGRLLLHTYDLKKVFYGLGSGLRQNLSWRDFKYLPCLVPPPDEQAAIARFLNHIDRLTRRYIRAQRRLIELLTEQEQALIQQAVTRGLNPEVKLKSSGVEWLGEIPAHWRVARVGSLVASLQTGPFGSQLHSYEYRSNGIPVINPSHMKDGRILPDLGCAVGLDKASQLARHRLQVGDIVFARRGELGRCALVGQQEAGWLCGTGSLRARLKDPESSDPAYLVQLFLCKGVADWLSLQSVGSTMENLNTGILSRLPLPLPPSSEQQAIVEFTVRQQSLTDTAITNAQRQIDHVREYRTRLIADVVTGKLDVRGVSLPELEEEGSDYEGETTDYDDLDEQEIEDAE